MIPTHRTARSGFLAILLLAGCQGPPPAMPPSYARELPPGSWGLRPVTDPARMPDMNAVAMQFYDPGFLAALEHSVRWFAIPSTVAHYPSGPITHEQARASVTALAQLARRRAPRDQIVRTIREQFEIYESVGWDGSGEVLFTGYYAPTFRASYTPDAVYRYPLYTRPADLVTDPRTGAVVGRRVGDRVQPYPERSVLEQATMLAGGELVYLASRLDAYTVEVNGSARLEMTDGSTLHIGYAGTNGHEYVSIGKLLVADGRLEKDRVSMPAIRRYFAEHPEQLDGYIRRNPRVVFFKEYDGGNWPAGSLGVPVTTMRSLATDKTIFPRGCAVLVQTRIPQPGAVATAGPLPERPFNQLMLDQDTGGAIRAAGRADIFTGIGSGAEQVAGHLVATGRLYYLLLKPQYVPMYDPGTTVPAAPDQVAPPIR